MVEYLRSLSKDELVKVRRSASEPQVALLIAMTTSNSKAEVKKCKDELMNQHLNDSLRRWLEWREGEREQLRNKTIDEYSLCEL